MIGESIFLQTLAYSGGGIAELLNKLAELGFFSFFLPFLLIFALIYGLLLRTKLFENKPGINVVIALAASLMAMQFDFVPIFFSQIFPRVGVGLAVILAVLIVVGVFLPKQVWVVYALFGVSAITILVILIGSAEALGWDYDQGVGFWLAQNWPFIVMIGFVVLVVALIAGWRPSTPNIRDVAGKTLSDLLGIK